jgi:hypothetical protein
MAVIRKKKARKVSNEGLPGIVIPDTDMERKTYSAELILNMQVTCHITVSAYTEDAVIEYDYREAGEEVAARLLDSAPLGISNIDFCEVHDLADVEEV